MTVLDFTIFFKLASIILVFSRQLLILQKYIYSSPPTKTSDSTLLSLILISKDEVSPSRIVLQQAFISHLGNSSIIINLALLYVQLLFIFLTLPHHSLFPSR